MERPKVLHHATRLDRVDKILKEGLKAKEPQSKRNNIIFNRRGVYLTTEIFGWMEWVTDGHRYKGAIISVDTEGLEIEKDDDLLVLTATDCSIDDRSCKDFLCPHDIPAENIISVSRESDDKGFVEEKIRR